MSDEASPPTPHSHQPDDSDTPSGKASKIWREANITLAIAGAIAAIFYTDAFSFKGAGIEISTAPNERGAITDMYWVKDNAIPQDSTNNYNILWAQCLVNDIAIGGYCVLHEPYEGDQKNSLPQERKNSIVPPYIQNFGINEGQHGWHCAWAGTKLLPGGENHRRDAAVLCAKVKKK